MLYPRVSDQHHASHRTEVFTTQGTVCGAGRPCAAAQLGHLQPEAASQNLLAHLCAQTMSRVPTTHVRGAPGFSL